MTDIVNSENGPTRERGPSLIQRMKSALKSSEEPEEKKYEMWDKDDPYSYTVGDTVIEKVFDLESNEEVSLYFQKVDKTSIRKIWTSFKVKRVSDVDNVEEQYRIKFHFYFNWLPTKQEYESYYQAKQNNKAFLWEPKWFPHLEFMNQIEEIPPFPRWEEYPDEGKFRFQKFKDFFNVLCDDPNQLFDSKKAYFIRAKFDVELILSEELELESFPFDCQDLSVIIRENSTDVKVAFLPELRKPTFGSIDPRYSVIDEWDMEAARIEFGNTNAGSSRADTTYPMIILRLKMKRRWQVFMWDVVFLMVCIEMLSLTCFSLDPLNEAGDRMSLSMTLLLTAVAFLYVVKNNLPRVPYLTFLDKYILSGYVFLMTLLIETAIIYNAGGYFDSHSDNKFFIACILYLFTYHVFFIVYAIIVRKREENKLIMDSDEVEKEVNFARPALTFDYRRAQRMGRGARLLAFQAMTKQQEEEEVEKFRAKQLELQQSKQNESQVIR